MEITCPRCQSLHEIEPPASVRARGPRSLKFRCSHCGHTFTVDPAPLTNLDPAPPPPLSGPAGEPIQKVRSGGQEFSVDGISLVRGILEGRIDRDAQVSNHGLRWGRAGDRDDLKIFFDAADAMSFQARNLRTEMPAEPDDEIIVDVGDADDAPPAPSGVAVVTVAAPGPPLERLDLDTVVMDFASRDETQEQTVSSLGVDEAPIPDVPAGFDVLEEPFRPAQRGAGLPVEAAAELLPASPQPPAPVTLPRPVPLGPTPALIPPTLVPPVVSPAPRPPDPPAVRSPDVLVDRPPVAPVQRSRPAPVVQPSFPELDSAPSARARDVFDDDVEPTRSSSGLWLAGGFLLLAALIAGVWWVVSNRHSNNESGEEIAAKTELPAPEAPTAPPAEAPKGVESPPPTPPPEVQPPAAKPAENPPAARPAAEPKPAAKAEPKPVAKAEPKPAEKPPSGKRLVTDAWKAVDAGEYDKAHGLFDRAFEASGSATALYGRGYTNEKLGDKVSAADDYCHALAVGGLDVDMTREVEGGLRRVGRACN